MADQADTKICVFCNKREDDELHYGKFHTSGKLSAHYYCLLFSSGLEQKGKDDEGIQGFLNPDIEKEVKRGTKLKCSKCQKTGATVGCCNKICKRTYHFPCGSEARMLNQYFGAFNSFCINHQYLTIEATLADQCAELVKRTCFIGVRAAAAASAAAGRQALMCLYACLQ